MRLDSLFAQLNPDAIGHIADGGTRGLLWALCIAILGLSASVVWLSRKLLAAQDAYSVVVREITVAHATALSQVHTASAATVLTISERMTTHVGALTSSTEAVLDVVSTMQDTAKLLEYTLDLHSAQIGRTLHRRP